MRVDPFMGNGAGPRAPVLQRTRTRTPPFAQAAAPRKPKGAAA